MGHRTDRAFDVMRERNRRYLEEQKKKDEETAGQTSTEDEAEKEAEESADRTAETEPEEPLSDEAAEELRRAEEKLRAYQEQNGGATGVYRYDEPEESQELPESEEPGEDPGDDLKEARQKAKEFHAQDDPIKLEKGDIPAMIISAILVFGPIFLVLFGLLTLAWFFLH